MRLGDIAKKSSLKLKMISEEELVDLHKVLLLMLDDLIEICKRKVITYGTYDLLHYGHIRLLERAKALGDYLIVGVTADDFDKNRGKINVQQSLSERIAAVRDTGLADEIIVEEYEGQKIDDIRRLDVDIFTVGSDWVGYFDYLKEYCKVVYLERTQGISSSEIRNEKRAVSLGLVGEGSFINKVAIESSYVNGLKLSGVYAVDYTQIGDTLKRTSTYESYEKLVEISDAVYIRSNPILHYKQVKYALEKGKHVLCEAPIALKTEECRELFQLAKKNRCTLVEGIKTAYSTAYYRLVLLAKTGKIGEIISVDATCTSIKKHIPNIDIAWNSMSEWGPTALLPVFQILGTNYDKVEFTARFLDDERCFDTFSKASFIYPHAVASIKVGCGVKSEGELVISGTEGYIYVPAPWWKTDYFEVRFENSSNNKRYFYQLDGEGIRYELADFVKTIEKGKSSLYISEKVSEEISNIMEAFQVGNNLICI